MLGLKAHVPPQARFHYFHVASLRQNKTWPLWFLLLLAFLIFYYLFITCAKDEFSTLPLTYIPNSFTPFYNFPATLVFGHCLAKSC